MSGINNSASSASDQASGLDQENLDKPKDVVSYETHRKLLSQKKAADERVEQLLKEKQQAEEAELQKKGDVQKLLKIKEDTLLEKEKEVERLKSEKENVMKTYLEERKLQAIKEKLPAPLAKPEYSAFLDTDSVQFKPDTLEIDETSVERVAGDFVKNHPFLLKLDAKILPNGSPKATGKLPYEEWLKLPVTEKRKRWKDVANK